MFETMAIFREILRENNMMLTPASLFRVDLRTLTMTLRALTFNKQGDSNTSSETAQLDESSTRNLQTVKSEGTQTTFTSADDIKMEEMSSTEEIHQVPETEDARTSIFTEGMHGYRTDKIDLASSEVDWSIVSDTAHKDDSDKTAEIKATNNYINITSRAKRKAIIDETISPSYSHESESGHGLIADVEEIDDTGIAQDSEISMYQIDRSEDDDQSYLLGMSSHLEEYPLGTFWDTSSVFNPNPQPHVFGDSITSIQNNPSSRISGSFLPDTEDMQPSETMIGSQPTRYIGYKFNPRSTERMTVNFNGRISSSLDEMMSSTYEDQHGFSPYFNIMGTVQGSDLAQSLQSFSNRASLDSSQFFVYSLDDMRNSQDSSPTQTFSFNAAASSLSHGDNYHTGFVLTPESIFEQHLPESAITPRYNSDFPNWRLSDSPSSENWSNSLSSVQLPIPTEPNLFSGQFPTETPKNQTVTPNNSKPSPTPAFQIPALTGSCSRDYPEVVFRVLRAIENIPQTHYYNCPHLVCKIPPPPVLPPRPPPFFKKPGIKYMLTKILYRDFVRKRRIMWEQAAMWDNTNVTHCP